MSTSNDFSMSKLSLNSDSESTEDWDRSMSQDSQSSQSSPDNSEPKTPRNSVVFPRNGNGETESTPCTGGRQKRSLSELLRLHAEKGTECSMSPEEAERLGDVLGEWINASFSPYEGEDDFFQRSRDDMSIRQSPNPSTTSIRPRGQSESVRSKS
ncbi:hypothetical protein E1B28_003172 [Marasmius oreades]|uniref:Uncharacterized protein n=1 Tax=Marasmius oreades TaxID=181124 RepID=A0A9P7UK72_9AGAR|nr:uncharacterized protein E1B28_003172 [Marasmius oreades]KAG7085623.1 hypothetical protein E1B28_003172 [Marasmius oreades]